MALEDLNDDQLKALGAIRVRRREITDSAAEETRALLGIINAGAVRRSDKRHKFMLLAGGIVGVSVPIMLQSPLATDFDLVRVGSALLMLTIVIGAIFDAIDERRTNPLVLRAAAGVERSAALAFAEDMKLIATQMGQHDDELDTQETNARNAAVAADREMGKAGEKFSNMSVLESTMFFGSFVLGVVLLVLAVSRVHPGNG